MALPFMTLWCPYQLYTQRRLEIVECKQLLADQQKQKCRRILLVDAALSCGESEGVLDLTC